MSVFRIQEVSIQYSVFSIQDGRSKDVRTSFQSVFFFWIAVFSSGCPPPLAICMGFCSFAAFQDSGCPYSVFRTVGVSRAGLPINQL